MTITLKHVFKHVFIDGFNNYQPNKPTVLACNHPNSFLDGIMFDSILPKPIYILTRGDSMNSKFKRSIFNQLYIVPIHRLSEGRENLMKNDETFLKCREILKNNGTVIIFSEGICVQEKRLRPLKKGTARICLEFMRLFPDKDLQVIPTGINLDEFNTQKTNIHLNIGKPLDLKAVSKLYNDNQAKGILEFNDMLSPKIKAQIIHLDTVDIENKFNQEYLPKFRTKFLKTFIYDSHIIQDKIDIGSQLNNGLAPEIDPKYHINFKKNFLFYLLIKMILLLSKVFFFFPNYLTKYVVNHHVSNSVFKHSVFVGLKMILGTVNCLILLVFIWVFMGWVYAVIALLIIYLLLQTTPIIHNYLLNYSSNNTVNIKNTYKI